MTDIEELKRLADQCICHPLSRSIGDIEQAGEAIKELIARLDAVEKELAAIRALEPTAWLDEDYDAAYTAKDMDGGNVHGLIALYALPEQK